MEAVINDLSNSRPSVAHLRALRILLARQGIKQVELAGLLKIAPISCSKLVDRMVARGLVERQPDPKDRRAWRIFLTQLACDEAAKSHELKG